MLLVGCICMRLKRKQCTLSYIEESRFQENWVNGFSKRMRIFSSKYDFPEWQKISDYNRKFPINTGELPIAYWPLLMTDKYSFFFLAGGAGNLRKALSYNFSSERSTRIHDILAFWGKVSSANSDHPGKLHPALTARWQSCSEVQFPRMTYWMGTTTSVQLMNENRVQKQPWPKLKTRQG